MTGRIILSASAIAMLLTASPQLVQAQEQQANDTAPPAMAESEDQAPEKAEATPSGKTSNGKDQPVAVPIMVLTLEPEEYKSRSSEASPQPDANPFSPGAEMPPPDVEIIENPTEGAREQAARMAMLLAPTTKGFPGLANIYLKTNLDMLRFNPAAQIVEEKSPGFILELAKKLTAYMIPFLDSYYEQEQSYATEYLAHRLSEQELQQVIGLHEKIKKAQLSDAEMKNLKFENLTKENKERLLRNEPVVKDDFATEFGSIKSNPQLYNAIKELSNIEIGQKYLKVSTYLIMNIQSKLFKFLESAEFTQGSNKIIEEYMNSYAAGEDEKSSGEVQK